MQADIDRVLYHESTILSRLDEMAHTISKDYECKELTVVSILNGSFIFMADLLRRIPLPLQIDSWSVSSYHGIKSKGRIEFRQNSIADVSGRHVLILDDILDSGLTLRAIKERLAAEPASVPACCCAKNYRSRQPQWRIMSALRFPMSLWWATGSTTTSNTGTCPS